jgi:hypothetical protein
MANHSIVSGTLRVYSTTPENTLAVCEAIATLTADWKNFSFEYTGDPVYEQTYVEVPFTGEGRWTFVNNVEQFGNWLQTTDMNTPAKEEAFIVLIKNEYSLEFCFQEEESSMMFIGDGLYTVKHKADTPLSAYKITDKKYDDYPFDVDHLVHICGYEEEYAKHVINGD